VTSTLFAAAALAFLLPFGTVSCEGEEVKPTGIELVTFSVEGGNEPGSVAADVENHGVMALFALVAALVGAGVALASDRGGGWAVTALCCLFLLGFNGAALLADVDFGPGYLLAFAALGCAGLLRFAIRIVERERSGERAWTWVLALMLGTPATAAVLLFFSAGIGY